MRRRKVLKVMGIKTICFFFEWKSGVKWEYTKIWPNIAVVVVAVAASRGRELADGRKDRWQAALTTLRTRSDIFNWQPQDYAASKKMCKGHDASSWKLRQIHEITPVLFLGAPYTWANKIPFICASFGSVWSKPVRICVNNWYFTVFGLVYKALTTFSSFSLKSCSLSRWIWDLREKHPLTFHTWRKSVLCKPPYFYLHSAKTTNRKIWKSISKNCWIWET